MTRERKRELRRDARAKAIPADPRAGQRVQERVLALPELAGARVVALYAAVQHEPPLERVEAELVRRGVRIVYPRIARGAIVFHESRRADLRAGYRGIPEPGPDAREVALRDIDVWLVPGLVFDRRGARLGRGRGHYDAALSGARKDAIRVGLCYADRVLPHVPEERDDERVHLIVTDDEVVRPAASSES